MGFLVDARSIIFNFRRKKSGKAKSIGVSNFRVRDLQKLMSCSELPVINQIEYHPFLYSVTEEVVEFCSFLRLYSSRKLSTHFHFFLRRCETRYQACSLLRNGTYHSILRRFDEIQRGAGKHHKICLGTKRSRSSNTSNPTEVGFSTRFHGRNDF